MSVVSAILPLERTRWFRDKEGSLATSKRYDEIVGISLDFTDQLASGETVSSAATEAHGVTVSSPNLATPVWTADVTGTGWLEVTATLSTGRKLQMIAQFYDSEGPRARDYA